MDGTTTNVLMQYLLELLQAAMYACIPVALGFLLKNGPEFKEWIKSMVANYEMKRILEEIWNTMEAAVGAVNQTYVNALKAENLFDDAAVREANKKAKEAFWNALSNQAKGYLLSLSDSGVSMMDTMMEKYVGDAKNEKKDEVILYETVL